MSERTPRQIIKACDIPTDPNVLPTRFLNAEKGDEKKGLERWQATRRFRMAESVDTILWRPHPHFKIIKKHSVAYYHKRAKNGDTVYYEIPKRCDQVTLAKHGVGLQELLHHFVWISEYLWRVHDGDKYENGRVVSVVDLTGIGMRDFAGDTKAFVQAISKMTGTHYPERSSHIFLLGAGFFFRAMWRVIKGWMDPVTVQKTHVCGHNDFKELHEVVGIENVPQCYGGTDTMGPMESPEEIKMAQAAAEVNAYFEAHPEEAAKLKAEVEATKKAAEAEEAARKLAEEQAANN